MADKTNVYVIKDDFTSDAGSTIYGIYSTREKAEAAFAILEDPDKNAYGCNLNENDTLEIDSHTLY